MKCTASLFLFVFLFLSFCCQSSGQVNNLSKHRAHALRGVKRIYVGSFGDGKSAKLFRASVIAALVHDGHFAVVNNDDNALANAVLEGLVDDNGAYFARLLDVYKNIIWSWTYSKTPAASPTMDDLDKQADAFVKKLHETWEACKNEKDSQTGNCLNTAK